MAIVCDSASLTSAAACFACIPKSERENVELYLLAVLAKGSLDPATLVRESKCFQCVPPEMVEAVRIMLLCNAATAAGA